MTEPVRGELPWATSLSRLRTRAWRYSGRPFVPWGRKRGWTLRAACREEDPELFFPEQGQSWKVPLAKLVCARCPVRPECRDLADRLEHHSVTKGVGQFGVWGGETVNERIARRRETAGQAASETAMGE